MNAFEVPDNTAVFTTTHVIRGGEAILYVSHEKEDGAWQFHNGDDRLYVQDAMIVSLREMIIHDPSICELSDMPEGWYAERSRFGAPWKRNKSKD